MTTTRIAAAATGALLITAAISIAQTEADATYKDIQQTLGFVPEFLKAFPEHGIAGAWEEMKMVEMNPQSALPRKTKELIGLGVAAQIPCRYCIYFHTNMARSLGASDQEIKEAVAVSALDQHWATFLEGMQIDPQKFKAETAKMLQAEKRKRAPNEKEVVITDAQSAQKDMERTFGFMPSFLRQFPQQGLAAAWREWKALELSPDTALDPKTKHLIGLGVSSQIPCLYCIHFDTEELRQEGASEAEIAEAVTIAGITRHWSTVLNGNMVDENAFRRDVDRMLKHSEQSTKGARR